MIATLGEALVDFIEQADGRFQPFLGGCVFNFSLGLARQGVPVSYLNPLSQDQFGARFARRLKQDGVLLGAAARSALPTSLALISLDAGGVPTYAFHRAEVADRDIDAAQLVASLPPRLTLLHTGGLALVPADLQKMLTVLRAASGGASLVSVDANLRPMAVPDVDAYVAGVRSAIACAHILKVSDEDLDILGWGALSPPEQAAALFAMAPMLELIALTRGAHGASLYTRGASASAPVPALTVVDTVGAGDCFHAGLLAYLLRAGRLAAPELLGDMDAEVLREALDHAVASASLNVMRAGCDPASWEEVLAFRRAGR